MKFTLVPISRGTVFLTNFNLLKRVLNFTAGCVGVEIARIGVQKTLQLQLWGC